MKIPLVIDCDPGVDDFIAISMALQSPELNVMALTTTGGNVPLRHTTRNALRALEAAGREEIPVAAGSRRALKGPFRYAKYFHGATGLTIRMPMPKTSPASVSATDFLANLLTRATSPVCIAAIGPLTNIALLLQKYPQSVTKIEQIMIMGGTINVPGNVTQYAEFNFWADPEAAREVLKTGLKMTLVGLDVCSRVFVTRRDYAEEGGLVGQMVRSWFSTHPEQTQLEFCDPLAIAALINNGLIKIERTPLSVVTTDGPERGKVFRVPSGSKVDVAIAVNAPEAKALIIERLKQSSW